MSLRIWIGYDAREEVAYDVAAHSLRAHASAPVSVTPLNIHWLAEYGLLRRPTDRRGQLYDIPSNAPASTDFAISRFLVPILAQSGWALFCDSDVVFVGDVAELFALADDRYAVMVVKHSMTEAGGRKMDNQVQTAYPRKAWSSVVLWNCSHKANKRLSLVDVQERRGFDLHGFYWLADSEIGDLPPEWNWLVGVQPKPTAPKLAHFTLGIPAMAGLESCDHAEIWWEALRCARAEGA